MMEQCEGLRQAFFPIPRVGMAGTLLMCLSRSEISADVARDGIEATGRQYEFDPFGIVIGCHLILERIGILICFSYSTF